MCEELRGTLALVEVGTAKAAEERSGRMAHLPPQLEGIPDEGSCQGGCEVLHQAGANLRLWICGCRYVEGGMNLRWIGMVCMRSMFNV